MRIGNERRYCAILAFYLSKAHRCHKLELVVASLHTLNLLTYEH